MSTRATYEIRESDKKSITFYIHYDGYPEGAVIYFKAVETVASKGGKAEAFLRANDLAEITFRHDYHGDIEYRYTLEGNYLLAYKYNWGTDDWDRFFNGELSVFISQYGQ